MRQAMYNKINPLILKAATQLLQKKFTCPFEITTALFLSEPERRNIVLRLKLHSDSVTMPKSVILKQSLPEQSDADDKDAYARFARDWAGLQFLSDIQQNTHSLPQFYGGNKTHRFILIEDLGHQHISLVDSLTHPYQEKAIAALSRFMQALGRFHATSFGRTNTHDIILRKINKNAETLQEDIDFTVNDLLPKLESTNQKLGLQVGMGWFYNFYLFYQLFIQLCDC